MTFTPPIRRKDTARGHHYVDATGARVPGVTTILGDGVPKPALINWAANATADAAINRWDELADMPMAARLKTLQGARYAEKDAAANRGTEVHALAEKLVKGEAVQAPDEIAGHVEAYARFLDEFKVTPVHIEFSVASHRHGYAGTGDLIADVITTDGPRRVLLDLKTNRSGIFGETALQLAAYRYADVLIDEHGEHPMPTVDACAAIHIRGDGYSLIPVTAGPTEHRIFLYAQQVAGFTKHGRDLVGAALTPPTTSTFRLVREDTPR
jgi:hypothetical protein